MKRIYLSLIVLMVGTGVMAQQDFYIFIQEPSHRPFYVRMGEESHSSSAEGHLILSKLKDSVYNLYVGLPKTRGEELFTISMKSKDHGYELRNNNGKRQLFDLQTLELINPLATTLSDGQTIRKTDEYSVMMAGVVDDSAVLYTSAADTLNTDTIFAKNKADSAAGVALADSSKVKKTVPVIAAAEKSQVKKPVPVIVVADSNSVVDIQPDSSVRDKRDIIRLRTENIAEGRMMIYVDRTGAVNDTIRIIIPRRL
ncbi:MAG TPA: hypothetical protein VM101_01830 [Flavitalea sp.]|nr:hypothetical protein [Flavitalea sp.]